jgi:Rieske Fe-S protein
MLLRGVALAGVATPVLAACGSDSGDPSGQPTNTATSSPGPSAPAGPLAETADVPVGEGIILADESIVLTQPAEGTFKAFSAICTHKGCVVATVTDGTIICPCHGSKYSVVDGSVVGGPAPSPLPEIDITVENGEISKA